MAGAKKLFSAALLKQQIIMMGKLGFRPNNNAVWKSVFQISTFKLRPLPTPAKCGRPRTR